ncbi:hypothetical protein BKE38_00325 [Pseudoroseomonas deserti]|uniref:Bacterial DNA polymerase III alpha subunit NTPase domain-containing protein n=1 Tax=Teichococcus deserti TaxID=1817963 RepID=A0A1V2H9F3_9PROT|nr:hypothetical protein BKE38_00325 [Pseudoroseomonas deserti]
MAATATESRLALPLFCAAAFYLDGHDHERLPFLAVTVAQAGRGAALLAWNDVRYHNRQRQPVADLVTAIRLTVTVDSLGPNAEPNDERCLKPPAAMARLFARHPEAITNTVRVLEATQGFSLSQLRHEYPDEILEPGRTPQQTLTSRVAEAADERWPNGVPANIQQRLNHELRLIQQLDYAPYFLTVHEVV